jgi:hypothetical protein
MLHGRVYDAGRAASAHEKIAYRDFNIDAGGISRPNVAHATLRKNAFSR